MSVNGYKSILIIRQSALGDVANVLPLLKVVRDTYPAARVCFLTGSATAGLVRQDPCVDEVLVWDRHWRPDLLLLMLLRLRRQHFDLVIDLHCSRYSRWLAWATAAPMRIGAHFPGFYTHLIDFDLRNTQISAIFRRFLTPLGLEYAPYVARFPGMEEALNAAETFLAGQGLAGKPYVVFNPGHSPAWGTKRWPDLHWIALGKQLVEQGLRIVVTGGPAEASLAAEISSGIGVGAISSAGATDLFCLAGLMNQSRAVVSTDSGPMHVAAMAGAHVVALFGPTHPITSAPFGDGHRIMHRELHCSYCFKKVCPYQHECLDTISPEEVLAAVRSILQDHGSATGEGGG